MNSNDDTIAAISTPAGTAGLGIIRTSGPEARRIAAKIFRRRGGGNSNIKSRYLYYGNVVNPQDGGIIDDVILAFMQSPHSYTGEDVVELYCHGSSIILGIVLELIISQGARMAEPGEFTRRAFLNNKIDLVQAEAVADIISARTEAALKIVRRLKDGELSGIIDELKDDLIRMVSHLEAVLDFPEEEIEELSINEAIINLGSISSKIEEIKKTFEWGRLYREGALVVISGRTNVGKSSLFNTLLLKERAIVTAGPGTTRDYIEESIDLAGLPINLIDTAGLAETQNIIEIKGIDLTWGLMGDADLILFLIDVNEGLKSEEIDYIKKISHKNIIMVLNKTDLPWIVDKEELKKTLPGPPLVEVSAKTGTGIEDLKRSIYSTLMGSPELPPPTPVIVRVRHMDALSRALEGIKKAEKKLREGMWTELIVLDLNAVIENMRDIIGDVSNDDILDNIFSEFCIGK